MKETHKYEIRSKEFYDGLAQIIECLQSSDLQPMQCKFQALIVELTEFVLKREIIEKNTHDIDYLLSGKMEVLMVLLQKFPIMK